MPFQKKKIFVTRFKLSLLLNIDSKPYAAIAGKKQKVKKTKSVNFSFKKLWKRKYKNHHML